MTDLLELAARCEAATGPDTRLDCLIENATGLAKFERDPRVGYGDADYNRVQPKPYTASLDAAMTLVPEGWGPSLDAVEAEKLPFAELWHREVKHDGGGLPYQKRATGTAQTLALALCAAALKARHQSGDGE